MNKIDKIYNTIVEWLEEIYTNIFDDQNKRVFVIGYLSALKDNKIIDNKEYLNLLEQFMVLNYY